MKLGFKATIVLDGTEVGGRFADWRVFGITIGPKYLFGDGIAAIFAIDPDFFAHKIQTSEYVLGGKVVVAVEIDQVIVDVVLLQVKTRDAIDVKGASRRVVAKSLLK